jgi:hypothetical protein
MQKMEMNSSKCWISKAGTSHFGEYHTEIAKIIFPKSTNPEYSCERAGYLKVYIIGGGTKAQGVETGQETQAQINELYRLSN